MPHYAAFHLGLHCLPKYLLGVSSLKSIKDLKVEEFLIICTIQVLQVFTKDLLNTFPIIYIHLFTVL